LPRLQINNQFAKRVRPGPRRIRRPIDEKLGGRFMIRNPTRVVKRHPKGDW
jgi:hypothetical protein